MRQERQGPQDVSESRIGRTMLTAEQRRERSEAIERLLIAGVSPNRIKTLAQTQYGMSEGATRGVVERVRRRWAAEEQDTRATYKATAMRRLYGHIAEARAAKHWPAVAQLERLLAEMQGTKEPMEVALNINAALGESAARVVAQLPPEKLAALIAEQRELRRLAAAATKPVVDTTGTETRGQAPANGGQHGQSDEGDGGSGGTPGAR